MRLDHVDCPFEGRCGEGTSVGRLARQGSKGAVTSVEGYLGNPLATEVFRHEHG
jgi:hypothetical protein